MDVFKLDADLKERDFDRLTTEQMTVWNSEHPKPESGDAFERKLLAAMHADSQEQIKKQIPTDQASVEKFKDFQSQATAALVGRDPKENLDLNWELTDKTKVGDALRMSGKLQNQTHDEELPMLFLHPTDWNGEVIVWTAEKGKRHLLNEAGKPIDSVQQLLDGGYSVVGVDLLMQGEFLGDGETVEKTRKVKNPREAAAYSFGYNHSLLVRRVHDLMTVVQFARTYEKSPAKKVHLIAIDQTAPIAAVARAVLQNNVDTLLVNSAGFRFGKITDIHDPSFMPGGAKYLDLPGFLALSAPGKTIVDSAAATDAVEAVFKANGASESLQLQDKIDLTTVCKLFIASQTSETK